MSEEKADDGLRTVMVFAERKEAIDFIQELPGVLRELSLHERFVTIPTPRDIQERQQRGRYQRKIHYFAACIRDRRPQEELPEISALDITQARERARRKAALPVLHKPVEWTEDAIPAFGRVQDIKTWARVFRTKPYVIRQSLQECEGDPETALSRIALKKSA
ncbi:hypothetical protein ACFYP4_02295 [Streptomyces sp. NPDC005551]|uniref:hypothetical protein n=1 Tax=Streptomyces sp. NPDC005551 TaxID=3364725 RepID=UPI00367D743F